MTRLEWAIAGRYLRSGRRSRLVSLVTIIATGGVTVGVTALIVVLGVMNGLQDSLREKILVASPHVRVLTYGAGLRLEGWDTLVGQIRAREDVLAAAPFVHTEGVLNAGYEYSEGVIVIGVDADTGSMAVTTIASHFDVGDLEFKTTREEIAGEELDGGIVLGARLAERLNAYPGDLVMLATAPASSFSASLGTFVPRYWRFEVTGIMTTGMYEYDNKYAVLSVDVAQKVAGLRPGVVSGIEVRLEHPDRADTWSADLERDFGYPYRAVDWMTQNRSLFAALKLEKLGMGLVLFFITVVAAFNIISTLVMVVRDKTREIGILRTMGLSAAAIRRIFIVQGVAIGIVGTILGTSLGLLVGYLVDTRRWIPLEPSVYFIDHLPVKSEPLDLLVISLACVVVAILATLYPAGRAAALQPVDAIRYE